MSQRQAIEEAGFEALQRLYEAAISHAGQGEVIARFLLSLYNGQRFPLDPSDLRILDNALFEDCMTLLRMDARVTAREVHTYFSDGGKKFEALANDWGVQDMVRVRQDAKRATQPEGQMAPVHEGGHFAAKLVRYGNAPGYRDITLYLRLGPGDNTEVGIDLSAQGAIDLADHVAYVNAACWANGRRPIDTKEGEQRPAWLDQTPAQRAGYL